MRVGAYPREAITGVVLAGGRGSRMGGADKGLVEVAGRPMVEHVLAAVERQAGAVAINANRSADRYARYGHPVIADRLDGFQGPLAGMASALEAAATEFVLVVPCDSPLLDPALGPRLHAALGARGADIAVAHDGERMHPVFVMLRRRVRPGLEDFLARGERRIDRWFAEEKTEVVDFSDLPDMFLNVNREADRSHLEARLWAHPRRGSGAAPRDAIASRSASADRDDRRGGLAATLEQRNAGARSARVGRDDGHGGLAATSKQRNVWARSAPSGRDDRGRRPPVIGFAGYSGSGKTTLVTAVVRALAAAGIRVAAVKHAHHSFDVDQPGKDSYELRRAGAVQTLVGSRHRWALVTEVGASREPALEDLVDRLDWKLIDIVLVEGFKHAEVPKIAVRREEDALFVDDPFVVAVATPGASGIGPPAAPALPRLDLDRPERVARFISERFLTSNAKPSPDLVPTSIPTPNP